jgi:phosphopantetheinyl transferase (holo-ACP synthase)
MKLKPLPKAIIVGVVIAGAGFGVHKAMESGYFKPKATIDPRFFDPSRLRLHVTISHEHNHAIGFAILERLVFQAVRA